MNEKLDLQLRKQIQKNKLIWGLVALAGFGMFIVFAALREAADSLDIVLLVLPAVFTLTFGISFFIGSLFCRFESVQSGKDVITVYRGMLHNILYINGVEKDRTAPFNYHYYLEGRLSDGSTATVAFARWYAFRLTFSNGQPPVEF